MKKLLLVCFYLGFVFSVFAQDEELIDTLEEGLEPQDTTYWDAGFSIGLNFNQAAFSGNWKAGGVNSVAFGSIATGKANYAKGKWSWDNQMEMIYGVVKNEGQEMRKSNDRIFLDSKVGYQVSDHWSYFGSLNFITQFADGFDFGGDEPVLISGFFAPAFIMAGVGMEYKPNDNFALRIAPISPRLTVVNRPEIADNVPENYGVPIGSRVRTEWLAAQIFMTYNKDITENLSINTRYQLFANYETLAFNTIDHRLDITVIAKITEWVDVTFTSINVYDIDMDPGIQYSQALALGILYKVGNKK
ncbi:hypothetical protein A33Q_1153 [Indibacter alkaliphilus LW1]|jgi:hypothetical protein|uniref:DUF3078 domain-containing protein n=1 Tax=Indibacter alkaliphilus (strain CCUG 57479 / KCTC 22604 / LW1) TaxID=1189612 RepID=S2DHN9_INDAL|nr:DUF3078 domain-containing protein [Indibacter alkaliphilus]EOZ98499.1 hypothetical protein A33Q_1153 [Indibacter alkaliphilus LW1]